MAGLSPFTVIRNIFVTEFNETFRENSIIFLIKPTPVIQNTSFVELFTCKFYLLKIKSTLFSSLGLMTTTMSRRDMNWFCDVVLSGLRKKTIKFGDQ